MNRRRHVGRQGPRRRGPDQQVLVLAPRRGDGQADREREVLDLAVALGGDLHVGEPRAAARAPRHHVVALVDQAPRMAFGQKRPDRVVVLVRVGVVAVLPVHPHPEPLALLGLLRRKSVHARLAQLHEAVDPERLDLPLVVEAQLALDLDLDPQALAIEPVLETLALAEHRVIALVEVLVGPSPGVVHTHRVVGSDRAVQERVAAVGFGVAREIALHRASFLPAGDLLALHGNDVELALDRPERPRLRLRHRSAPTKNPSRCRDGNALLSSRGTTRA